MLNQTAPVYQTSPTSQQNNQLLGTPQLQPQSSPYFNSSYGGPPSSFFIPSSIPVPQQQPQQQAGGNVQNMIAALQGRGA